MKKIIYYFTKRKTLSFLIFVIFLIFFQFLKSLQGFELCDSGFYATFYQNFFHAPSTVQNNFYFWFTGLIGGLFVNIFPDSGLLGIRLLNILFNTILVILLYLSLKKYIKHTALFGGIFLCVISFVETPPEFYYDTLSSVLFLSSALLLFYGLNKKKYLLLILSGFFVALNIFTRLNNVLNLSILLIILFYSYYNSISFKYILKTISLFLIGFVFAVLLTVVLMKFLGHLDIFVEQIKQLVLIAEGKIEDSHNLKVLLSKNFKIFKNVFYDGVYAMSLLFLTILLVDTLVTISLRWIKYAILFGIIIIITYLLVQIRLIHLLYFFGLLGVLVNIFLNPNINLKLLSWLGLLMMLTLPFGSDGSIYNVGNYSIWLSLPLLLNIFPLKSYGFNLNFNSVFFRKDINPKILNYIFTWFLLVFILNTFVQSTTKVYFDNGIRFKKIHSLNNPKLKCIYTTQERSIIINELLYNIKPYIKNGDELIVYESMPMIHYLTNTKPYFYTSWLESISDNQLKNNIKKSKIENRKLPLVLRQKFQTLYYFGKPTEEYLIIERDKTGFGRKESVEIFNTFLKQNKYEIIWQNSYFVLYAPLKN